ncbi:reverse transcriptase domain-containing protein [Tanacetum coccineum]
MADNRTMAQLLEAPTEGYEDAIVVPEITANNFEIKHGLLNLVQNKQFFGHDKEDPHAHIRYFNKITSTMKFPNVPSTSVKLMLFPFSLEGAARIWLEKEPPRSILTWDDLVSKFINKFFPPSKTTNLRNEITRFQQKVVAKVSTSSSTPVVSPDVAKLKDMVRTLILDMKNQTPAPVKAVEHSCVSKNDFESYVKANDAVRRIVQTQGQTMQNQLDGLQNQLTNLTDMLSRFVASNTASTSGLGTLPGNTVTNPKEDLKGITTRSGVTYQGPTIPPTTSSPKVMNRDTEPVVAPVSAPMPNQRTSIPFPSRRNDERRREKANDQIEKFYEIFRDLSFKISFTDALILMPKFASTLKTLIGNKEKLSEMARTPLNENCSAVILNKLPKKLGDPGRFLIPCEFTGIDTCNALADLGASINLMPYSVWNDLSLPELTPTCMTLKLADRSITKPIGIAKDVRVMVENSNFQPISWS